jgi:hypothetical protein
MMNRVIFLCIDDGNIELSMYWWWKCAFSYLSMMRTSHVAMHEDIQYLCLGGVWWCITYAFALMGMLLPFNNTDSLTMHLWWCISYMFIGCQFSMRSMIRKTIYMASVATCLLCISYTSYEYTLRVEYKGGDGLSFVNGLEWRSMLWR